MSDSRSYRVMLVEDDPKIGRILTEGLERYGMTVAAVDDFARVKETFCSCKPDLVLLDINLPRYDGYYWCRQIRTLSRVPIIFISARDQDVDQVRALESGGDDYISKPFNLELAVAKINSMLRRTYGEYAIHKPLDALTVGDLVINKGNCSVSRGQTRIELSAKEMQLLFALAQRGGDVVSREELLEVLWDDESFVDDNTLTVNVSRLRKRLEELGLDRLSRRSVVRDIVSVCRGSECAVNLWSFLRDRVLYIALYAGFCVVTVAIIELDLFFSGATLRVANVLYLWLLGLVGLAGFLLVDYRKHVAFAKRLESISADEPLDRLGFLAEPRTLEQRVFANAWASLYARLRAELIEERNRGRHNVELVSQWAHHMKSPVSVIDLELQRASQMDMSPELAEVVLSVGEENQRLNNSIQMLLNLVRLEDFAADFASEQVDLLVLVRQLINDNRRMFITHRVYPKILLDEGDTSGWSRVVSDSKWLRFTIQQVVSNAIKYSSRATSLGVNSTYATDDGISGALAMDGRDTSSGDGEVTLSCRKGEPDGEVVLEIADNGIGIAAEDLGRVFDPFFTGANGRAFPQSTGMGLYLARQACLRLGHRISIESRPGAGTRVSIAFPADQTIFAGVNASVAQTGR